MEKDIQHSAGVFKNENSAPNNNKEDQSVYVNLKMKKPSTSETQNKEEESVYVNIKSEKPSTIETPFGSRFHLLLVSLGIICFLLCVTILCVSIIIIISYFTMETNKQKQNLSDLEAKNEQLTLEKRDLQIQTEDLKMNMTKLENQTEHLTLEKKFFENQTKEMTVNMTIQQTQIEQLRNNSDKLNRIKAAIFKYYTFPVDLFCPDGVCQTCPKDWIQFQESCYFFFNSNSLWKTWYESRQLCQNKNSDLVVISSQEEQTFIKSRIEFYFDTWHGYWIGLRRINNNNWIWVDDSQDTLGYWYNPNDSNDFTLIRKDLDENQSWSRIHNGAQHRFICEIKALIF